MKMLLGKDQQTAVIGHQVKATIRMAEVPSDPTLPYRALLGSGRKGRKGYPVIAPVGYAPKGFADLVQRPHVVIGLHSLPEMRLFAREKGPDKDFPQVQDNHPDQVDEAQSTEPYIPHPPETVQNYT
jgi:hypothetical protein